MANPQYMKWLPLTQCSRQIVRLMKLCMLLSVVDQLGVQMETRSKTQAHSHVSVLVPLRMRTLGCRVAWLLLGTVGWCWVMLGAVGCCLVPLDAVKSWMLLNWCCWWYYVVLFGAVWVASGQVWTAGTLKCSLLFVLQHPFPDEVKMPAGSSLTMKWLPFTQCSRQIMRLRK